LKIIIILSPTKLSQKMEHYISQLIEDLHSAHRKEQSVKPSPQEEETFESYIAEVERYISGEGYESISSILGLEEFQFPPIERLTDEQMFKVILAFDACLASWNVCLDMPENLPIPLQYKLYLTTLSQKINPVDYGMIHLETCSYNTDNCQLGEYCHCSAYEDDYPDDMNINFPKDGELPF
jgi:hypothetical protein